MTGMPIECQDVARYDGIYNLSAHLDPHNAGVLVVDLQGRQVNGRTRDAGGLVDEIGKRDGGDDCIIM